MVTIWTPQASAELKKAYDYISKDSPPNALKIVEEITRIADQLPAQPEMFPPDKFKKNNDGNGGLLKNITTEFPIELLPLKFVLSE